MIIIKMYKKILSVTLLAAVAMFAGTAAGKYVPYKGPAVAPVEATKKAAEKPTEVQPAEATKKAAEKPTEVHQAQLLEPATVVATHGNAGVNPTGRP